MVERGNDSRSNPMRWNVIRVLTAATSLFVLVAVVGSAAVFWFTFEGPRDWHPISQYPALCASCRRELVAHFPGAIPANAKGVRIFSPSGGVPPPQDRVLELRMVVSPAEAADIEKALAQKAISVTDPETRSSLRSIDDMDSSTSWPTGFRTYKLIQTPSGDSAGATINASTGEVVFWCFDL